MYFKHFHIFCTEDRIAVLIWIGMFAICILQLLVAGALYGGTNEVRKNKKKT